MPPLHDQHILILGLGISGLAMARWCARQGAHVTVADTRDAPPGLLELRRDVPDARVVTGPFNAALIGAPPPAAVFRSPGLSPDAIASVLKAAVSAGCWIGGELSLFSEGLEALRAGRDYQPAVLAVTGTNGKTTVTSLTGQLVERAGKSVAVAGNIGPTLLDTLADRIDHDALPEVWVIELSSFQLDSATGFEPTAATILNLTQDHLDWHGSMAAYEAAKTRVFGERALMILNRDDSRVMALQPVPVKGKEPRRVVSFGADLPARPGDWGLQTVNGMTWLARALEEDGAGRRRREAPEALHFQHLMPVDALRIRGRHNAVNALAALALAVAAGCSLAPMLHGLREYRGEPHRVEPVGVVRDVEYFDDSKGTNVGATVAALHGLGVERRLVVILGGEGKGQDFSPLAAPVAQFARAVVLMGRDGPVIRAALADCGVPLFDAVTMHEAVRLASVQASAGDAVLMSPACASFDMFENYGHRAQVFRAAVGELASESGSSLEAMA